MAEFFNNYFLWRDPLIVAAFSGLICGFFGVYVVLKRMVFVSAALTQVSGFWSRVYFLPSITISL